MSSPKVPLSRPRIKPEHAAYRAADGTVRLGSTVYGIGVEVEDPDGWVWALAEALDGTRTVAELAEQVSAGHPGLEPADVAQAVLDLHEAGHLEDLDAPPTRLGGREQERHSRGVPLLRWLDRAPRATPWEMQERLADSRVLLIGVGGTGGHAARALVASGVGRLHCVDNDTVELSNLNRQSLFGESDVGRPKIAAALRVLRDVNSAARVTGEQREVTSAAQLAALVAHGGRPFDLLLVCADRPPEICRWANRVGLDLGVPWLDGGYFGPVVSVGVHVPGRGACWECLHTAEAEARDLGLPPGADESAAFPRFPWSPANAVTAGLSGLLIAHAAVALLTGAPPLDPGFRFGVNLAALDDRPMVRAPRRPDCPACGGHADSGGEPRE